MTKFDVRYGWVTTIDADSFEEALDKGAQLFHDDWISENVDIPLKKIREALHAKVVKT